MARFFIDRPIFAWVIAIVIMLAGALSILTLPVAQYPTIAPPRSRSTPATRVRPRLRWKTRSPR
jgi:multidrug efflux pump